jgi:hypothetical protein
MAEGWRGVKSGRVEETGIRKVAASWKAARIRLHLMDKVVPGGLGKIRKKIKAMKSRRMPGIRIRIRIRIRMRGRKRHGRNGEAVRQTGRNGVKEEARVDLSDQ